MDLVIRCRWLVVDRRGGLLVGWVFFPWNSLVARAAARRPGAGMWRSRPANCFPYQNIGSEFMPPLYEGDLLYMPTTFPGISADQGARS